MPIRVPPRLVLPRASSTTNRRESDKASDELPKDELKQEAKQDTSSANDSNLTKKGNSSLDKKRIESKPRTTHRASLWTSDSSRASKSSGLSFSFIFAHKFILQQDTIQELLAPVGITVNMCKIAITILLTIHAAGLMRAMVMLRDQEWTTVTVKIE